MTREEIELTIDYLKNIQEGYIEGEGYDRYPLPEWYALNNAIEALEQEPCEDCISRADALRVAKNEYLRGWHDALHKALNEKYSIHCEEGNFSVIQEETITGLGLSMDCAVGKDVESYIGTIPRVTPQEPILDKIREEIEQIIREEIVVDSAGGEYERIVSTIDPDDVLEIIDKYKAESEG